MILSFENSDLLNITSNNSNFQISCCHFKDGKSSLEWSMIDHSELFFNIPVEYCNPLADGTSSKMPCFGVYLYCESKLNGKIRVKFWKNKKVCCSFLVHLGFTGWRSVLVRFLTDMEGAPCENMDNISFEAINAKGTIYIDQLVSCNLVDPRSVVSSHQVPYIEQWYVKVHKYWKYIKIDNSEALPKELKEKYLSVLLEDSTHNIHETEEIKSFVKSLEITCDNGIINGKPVEFIWQYEIYDGQDYLHKPDVVSVEECCNYLFSIAYHYTQTKSNELAKMYVLVIRHIMDQGYGVGSSMGVLHHIGYALRLLYPSVLLMEDVLKKEDFFHELLDAMMWISEYGTIFLTDITEDTVTVDTLNIQSQAFLIISILLNSSKVMMQLKEWLDFSCLPRPGLRGLFKDDGSVYHHCNHYTAYGMDALEGLMPVLYTLSGTEYDISSNSISTISKCMLAMRFYCERIDYPISMSGRHPDASWHIHTPTYRLWALSEANRGNTDFIGVYLRLLNNSEIDDEIKNFNVAPEPTPQGHLTLGGACASFHRINDHLVCVKGFSKYLWGHEALWSVNSYGRYMSYGHFEIMRENHKESGFSHDGFDWAAIPGSTAIHYSIPRMKSNVYNLDEFSGIEEMLISDEAFAGGVDDGVNGMFAMKLHGHPKYDGSHRAIKSYVMHDKFVICLGSDIQNDETDFPTHTVLFQKAKDDTKNAKATDGGVVDTKGNYYYSPNEIILSSSYQNSVSKDGKTPTTGEFWQCYINHGNSPKNAQYEYSVTVSGSDKPDYEVIQKDNVAHIVSINDTTYYAIFEPEKFKGYGKIQKVNHMLLVMVCKNAEKYEISVCQPDLGIYDIDDSQYVNGKRIEVSIYSRKWLGNPLKEYDVQIEFDNGQIFECTCEGGKSYRKVTSI